MSADKWLELGDSLLEELRYTEAEAAFREAIDLEPRRHSGWNGLGRSLLGQDLSSQAVESFRKAVRCDPTYHAAWYNLGISLMEQGNNEEAEEVFRHAIGTKPKDPSSWLNIGRSLIRQDKYVQAEEAFRHTTKYDPTDHAGWYNLGLSLQRQDRYEEAEQAYTQALALEPEDPSAFNNLGNSLRSQGKTCEAEQAYLSAIDLAPDQARYRDNLAMVLIDQNKYFEAEQSSRLAIDIDPNHLNVWFNLGLALWEQEKVEEAESCYLKAIDLEPLNGLAWYNLGVLLSGRNDHEQAEGAYRRCTTIDPSSVDAWFNLGSMLNEQSRYSEAKRAYRRALALEPEAPDIWMNLGVALRNNGEYQETAKVLRKAMSLQSNASFKSSCLYILAVMGAMQNLDVSRIVSIYRKLARAIEDARGDEDTWEYRLQRFQNPAAALRNAAAYCFEAAGDHINESLSFAVQSKARTLSELLEYDPSQLTNFLPASERRTFESLEAAFADLERERHDRSPGVSPTAANLRQVTKRLQSFETPETEQIWQRKRVDLEQQREAWFERVVKERPELEPFVIGPKHRNFRFSIRKLQKILRPGEAVLEIIMTSPLEVSGLKVEDENLLGFLITREGMIRTYRWGANGPDGADGWLSVQKWQAQVISTLQVEKESRVQHIGSVLTNGVLSQWGQLLYRPFIQDLKDIHRLIVSPHSFLTQLPFNAIPFPDGIEREVALVPSASSLVRSSPPKNRPKPRFTLGVIGADSGEVPLDLQTVEVQHLRGCVRSSRRRWELAGIRPGEQPTLDNLKQRTGLTRCLVLSCHGDGPNADWGTLALGTRKSPQYVSGKELVDGFLLGSHSQQMEVDLVVTSACLTGQLDVARPEEWLGLPLALQAVWKTKTLLLTLWEVDELAAMIWVVTLVDGLTDGLTAGEAQRRAQGKVMQTTYEQVENIWLSDAKKYLTIESWNNVYNRWRDFASISGDYPFSNPVYWAPFVLIGDPTLTISPRRPA